jgi:hypothetical protein
MQAGGVEALIAVGFVDTTEEGERVFVLPEPAPPHFADVKAMLDEAIEHLRK